jgi:hypothetical protein
MGGLEPPIQESRNFIDVLDGRVKPGHGEGDYFGS